MVEENKRLTEGEGGVCGNGGEESTDCCSYRRDVCGDLHLLPATLIIVKVMSLQHDTDQCRKMDGFVHSGVSVKYLQTRQHYSVSYFVTEAMSDCEPVSASIVFVRPADEAAFGFFTIRPKYEDVCSRLNRRDHLFSSAPNGVKHRHRHETKKIQFRSHRRQTERLPQPNGDRSVCDRV
jgi:hypothetical protein